MATLPSRPFLPAALLAASLGLAGCGAVAGQVAERAVEEGIERAGSASGDVELDLDNEDGSLSIESSEGSLRIGAQDVPEDFPAEVPLPDDAEVMSSMSFSEEAGTAFNLNMNATGDAATLGDELESRFSDAGFTLTGTSNMEVEDLVSRSFQFEGPDWSGNVSVVETADSTMVNYTVTPTTGG